MILEIKTKKKKLSTELFISQMVKDKKTEKTLKFSFPYFIQEGRYIGISKRNYKIRLNQKMEEKIKRGQ